MKARRLAIRIDTSKSDPEIRIFESQRLLVPFQVVCNATVRDVTDKLLAILDLSKAAVLSDNGEYLEHLLREKDFCVDRMCRYI